MSRTRVVDEYSQLPRGRDMSIFSRAFCSGCSQEVATSSLMIEGTTKIIYEHPREYLYENQRPVGVDWTTVCEEWHPVDSDGKRLHADEPTSRFGVTLHVG